MPRTALDARPERQLVKQLKQFFPEVQLTGTFNELSNVNYCMYIYFL